MKVLIAAFFSIVIIATSCQKEDVNNTEPQKAETLLNISYGTDTSQRMDVYLPAGRSKDSTKVMVLIHGGAWSNGDKKDFEPYVAILKTRLPEYAIININYRLATQATNHFPTQEQDVKAAMEFVIQKSGEYAISEKLVLLGASAGGHLALLQAYKYAQPAKPKAVISFFGPTDFVDMYNHPVNPYIPFALTILLEGTPTTKLIAYQQSSPVTFVSPSSPPTLLLHGTADDLVSVNQSIDLDKKLKGVGVTSETKIYEGAGHGWFGEKLEDSFNQIVSFLNKTVK